MTKKSKRKAALDKQIDKHAEDRMSFVLVSNELGPLHFDVSVKELFDNLTLVYMDPQLKKYMKLGYLYEYSASAFAGACEPTPMYMFAAGVDPSSDDLFNVDPDKEYGHIMCYAFPVDKLSEWTTKPDTKATILKYEMPKDIDFKELEDLLYSDVDPEILKEWIEAHGGKPI